MRRTGALAAAFLLAATSVSGDLGKLEVSADFDAEFARAADLLEEGKRPDAEQILETIRRNAGRPSWDARVVLLLASDDVRRGNDAEAAVRLRDVSAAPIGLDAYRLLMRAQALERAGSPEEAIEASRQAFEAPAPFGFRTRAAVFLARLLETRRRAREASDALAQAAVEASASEIGEISLNRIRLGLAAGNTAEVQNAARDLILRAPTLDAVKSTPAIVRKAAREAEARLTPADLARRGRALVQAGDPRRGVPLLSRDRPSAWPEDERGANLLALARGQLALKKDKEAEATAARVTDDGTPAAFEARLFRCDRVMARIRGHGAAAAISPEDPRWEPVRLALEGLTATGVAPQVRRGAQERLLRLDAEAERFEDALGHARDLVHGAPGSVDGFEPLWRLAWSRYVAGDCAGARERFDALASLYDDVSRSRRLRYWRARCLMAEGRTADAAPLLESLAGATPRDIYARFAQARGFRTAPLARPPLADPSTATAAFARVDELLRLRMFEQASAEARALSPSRGRDLRLAQSDFALGRFLLAAAAIKRAIPEIGTAEEGRVPDGWRRLYYPIEEGGFLTQHAKQYDLDTAVLRGLVRQESAFDAKARSRAGAMGLTQLMPATAKSLARSVLRSRYRRAFLYDPGVNAELGAAYLRRLIDQFGGSQVLALAAYNGGPTRIARVVRESPGRSEDEIFESIPLFETRDYVRRVLLYSESYRELYP